MTIVGSGEYTYEMVNDWGNLPPGCSFGAVSAVAVDSQDRVYAFQRKDPPVVVLDRDGNYLGSWGDGTITFAHGIHVGVDDRIYLTDRDVHVAVKYTLDGQQVLSLGNRGVPSNTGCTEDSGEVFRAAEPFNKPASIVDSLSGDIYVADGYRNSRVHRFDANGTLISSWGEPGHTEPNEFHVPHCLWSGKDGLVYVCDRDNSRIQVFSATGEFRAMWTDFYRPTGVYIDSSETVYVSDLLPSISVCDKQGNVLTRWHAPGGSHWIYGDSRGDLYMTDAGASFGGDQKITKFVKRG